MLNLPLKDVWGIGEKTLKRLNSAGIYTTKNLHNCSKELLTTIFGECTASFMYDAVRGKVVKNFDEPIKNKSISAEKTFCFDLTDMYTIETALMQRTGHAVRSETKRFIELIVQNRKNKSKLMFIPIHGDHHQLAGTAKVIREAGGEPSICYNSDVIKVWAGGTKKLDNIPVDEQRWIAVQENSLSCRGGFSEYEYTLVDKDFMKVEDLFVVGGAENFAIEREYTKNSLQKAWGDEDNFYMTIKIIYLTQYFS